MDTQPNEIITHILFYLDNYTLMFARSVCHQWKHLIETRIFYKKPIPDLHVCIMTNDYYHFGKYYLDYDYDARGISIMNDQINDAIYYDNLVTILPNKKIFRKVIPRTTLNMSTEQLLIYASYMEHLDMTKYLIGMGADLHANSDAALRWGAFNGHLEMIKYLISMGADFHANNDHALRWSARNGHYEMTKYLISMGANLHAANDDALQSSAVTGHLEVVKYLISMGANLHAENDAALRGSAYNGHLEVVKYLISVGADIHTNNNWILKISTPNVIEYLISISEKN